ncbi:MAG: ATP-binding protein [Methanobacterium sp.]|uniref:ATP-binding protein n=1 Tax=Methanobacterium sp. TaxID=2164 RepID=UPI003D6619DB|nr:ATP-binding protein [Methanobacterium sp.]
MGFNMTKTEKLAIIDVKAELKLLPMVLHAVREVSQKYGLEEKYARDLELATEEACHNVIEHAYPDNEKGYYQVEIHKEPTKFVITVKDQGIPFNLNLLTDEQPTDLGIKIMRAYTDEINSKYLGKEGKEVELVKYLPFEPIEEPEHPIEEELLAPKSEEISLRIMRPDETVALARCIYKVYGYTYPHEDIYYPQKFSSLIESGLVTSCVTVNSKDDVIGHLGVFLENPDDLVGESALAAVDSRYRGRGIFPKMKNLMMEHVQKKGLLGLYSRAVTVHVASQKSNVKMGAKETGFVLAHSPPTAIFKKMEASSGSNRRTVALFYVPVAPDPGHNVFLPLKHGDILKKIYNHGELKRTFNQSSNEGLSFHSQIHSHLLPEMSSAFLRVNKFGIDFLDELKLQVNDLCYRHVELIVLDLPLSDPATALLCPEIEDLGFFFSGLMPEYLDGDALRLQYLNNVIFNPEDVQVYSEFGKDIFSYVVEEWKSKNYY